VDPLRARQREERRAAVTAAPRRAADEEFTAFVKANYSRLRQVADLLCNGDGRAEDLLQTVLIRTYQRWSKVRQENPIGYVRAGLANARTDWWRRWSSRERPVATPPETRAALDHAGHIVGRDVARRALALLTRRERAVIVLRFYEDLSEAEIAATLGIAPGTVKSTCVRALAKLRISPDLNESITNHTPDQASRINKDQS
jgi:RNA polymerase sigma-70 factor (sigma-E family)